MSKLVLILAALVVAGCGGGGKGGQGGESPLSGRFAMLAWDTESSQQTVSRTTVGIEPNGTIRPNEGPGRFLHFPNGGAVACQHDGVVESGSIGRSSLRLSILLEPLGVGLCGAERLEIVASDPFTYEQGRSDRGGFAGVRATFTPGPSQDGWRVEFYPL